MKILQICLSKRCLTIYLALFLFNFVDTVKADSDNFVDRIPAILNDFEGIAATLFIQEDHIPFQNGDIVRITLPYGVKWNYAEEGYLDGTSDGSERSDVATFKRLGDNTIEIQLRNIGSGGTDPEDNIQVPLDITVEDAEGDLLLSIDGMDSTISSGQYLFATVPVEKEMTITTGNVKQNDKHYSFDLGIEESAKGTLQRSQPIRISLPSGFIFIKEEEIKTVKGNSKKLIVEGLESNEISIKLEDSLTTEATKWVIPLQVTIRAEFVPESGDILLIVDGNRTDLNLGYFNKDNLKKIRFKIGRPFYLKGQEERQMDTAPYIKNNRTFLPVRYVAEALGLSAEQIGWNGVTRTVYLSKDSKTIHIPMDRNKFIVNGKVIEVEGIAAEMLNNRVMVPIGYIMELFDVKITWEEETQTITIG